MTQNSNGSTTGTSLKHGEMKDMR